MSASGIIKRYVEPRIGARPLQKLSGFDLNSLYDELEESGGENGRPLSAKPVLNVHRVLHKAFNDAVREGVLARNPAAAVQAPSAPKALDAHLDSRGVAKLPPPRRRGSVLRRLAALRHDRDATWRGRRPHLA